jgi:hypothetical protein
MSHSRAPLVAGGALLALAVTAAAVYLVRARGTVPPPAPPVTVAATPLPPTPPPTAEPSPEPTPEPEAPPVSVATGSRPKTPPKPKPTKPRSVDAADAAVKAGKYDEAVKLYEEVAAGDAKISSITRSLKRRFVPALTQSWSTKGVDSKLQGFDTGSVDVKRVPENDGRIDFVVVPPRLRPGDPYRVDVHLTNGGKKPIRIAGVTAVRNADGKKEGGAVQAIDKREIETRQRERIATLEGVWPDDLQTWSLEVNVAARNGDAYLARLKWE